MSRFQNISVVKSRSYTNKENNIFTLLSNSVPVWHLSSNFNKVVDLYDYLNYNAYKVSLHQAKSIFNQIKS